MRRLIISSRENEVLQLFFLKRGWGTWFFSEEITICLFFSEEIMRHLIFFWINNEVLGLVTSIILWMMLCLQWKNKVPHYFFRKKWSAYLLLQKKHEAHHYFFRKNEAPHYCFRKKWSASLWVQNRMKHLVISAIKNQLCFFLKKIMLMLFQQWKNEAPPNFFRKNEVPQYFFRKKWGASLFLQKKMKHLIISSEKNEAPHYFLKKNEMPHVFQGTGRSDIQLFHPVIQIQKWIA